MLLCLTSLLLVGVRMLLVVVLCEAAGGDAPAVAVASLSSVCLPACVPVDDVPVDDVPASTELLCVSAFDAFDTPLAAAVLLMCVLPEPSCNWDDGDDDGQLRNAIAVSSKPAS